MNKGFTSTLLPVLLAPWQQRRNTTSMWGTVAVVFMLSLVPILLFVGSLVALRGASVGPVGSASAEVFAGNIRHAAANAGLCALAASLLAAWVMLVSNLLDQNRPVLARIVPGHPARLRTALLLGWVAAVAAITLLVGVRFDAPLACAAVAAVGLALLAAAVRWPMMWMLGCVAPLGVDHVMAWPGLPLAIELVRGHWHGQPVTLFLTLAAGSAVLLVALIQNGGARHVTSDAARRRRALRLRMRWQGGQPVAAGTRGLLDTVLTRPYYAWFGHVLSRPTSPLFARLMLGLGPGAHWMASATAVIGSALALFAGMAVLEGVGLFYPPVAKFAPTALASLGVGVVIGLLSPAIQVQARLHQSRREQALLVLLPGVPRGATLNRRLAWQLTGQFVLAWIGALALMALCLSTAHALRPEAARSVLSLDPCRMFAIAVFPMIVFQWRAWSRASAPTALSALGPLLLGGLAAVATWAGPFTGWLSPGTVATLCSAATMAWCSMRWWRLGREPSALPVGRLA